MSLLGLGISWWGGRGIRRCGKHRHEKICKSQCLCILWKNWSNKLRWKKGGTAWGFYPRQGAGCVRSLEKVGPESRVRNRRRSHRPISSELPLRTIRPAGGLGDIGATRSLDGDASNHKAGYKVGDGMGCRIAGLQNPVDARVGHNEIIWPADHCLSMYIPWTERKIWARGLGNVWPIGLRAKDDNRIP